ncbi:putative selenate ABC transporter substrate-binding protein [Kushneria phosphatilytica]|uniref:Putative selenate ABC transporter substrate-binding protein n=1 Tax=Kushneria phosphatilytica TaxID=657387 RepID=A0A1S1NVF6_9GAMM|nr:putative selenate ABC transporter substrate-binding protein [Kushneria phosphatilytica]OHV10558.1 putative selenate ABC transporter substrate-binding protein [Kushneria phosphatilytica]QEL11869.1 putative selenate ABC transporter substrate-binding protein [Kushneria phosphatilytica]
MRWLLALLLTLISVNALADTFRFTAIPDENEDRLVARFDRVADYLSQQTGLDVEYVPVKSYPAAVSAFRNDQVQLAWFGGLTGVQARSLVPNSEAIAQGKEDAAFRSYYIANASTGIAADQQELPDAIRGHSFTFGAKTSTSGRLMPEYYLRQRFEQSPQQLFSRVGFSGDHTRTIALVESGAYDIGAVNYKVWQAEVRQHKVDTNKVHVIWKSPRYPDYQWTIRGDVDQHFGEGTRAAVRQALLDMTDPELLKSFPREGFIPVSNDDYEPIKRVGKQLGLLR